MIKHIVMWKLLDYAEGKSKAENAKAIKDRLEALKNTIPEIQTIEVGINCVDSEQAFDVVLYSVFDSLETLNLYQTHPEHQKVVQFIGKVRQARVVVDYET